MNKKDLEQEAGLAVKFALVGLVGFAIDAIVLRGGLALGFQPAIARAASIICAMQVTFVINGLYIFRCLTTATCPSALVAIHAHQRLRQFGELPDLRHP